MAMALTKLVSGGETGVDRAALDAALAAGFPCGGWTPADRMAEDGVISERYPLTPLPKGGYRARTRQNVVDSDGTAMVHFNSLKGGTRLTRNLCALEKKPYVLVNAERLSVEDAVVAVLDFIEEHNIAVLNVAGPRASGWADGYGFTLAVMRGVIDQVRGGGFGGV
jgi:hypothetical protein